MKKQTTDPQRLTRRARLFKMVSVGVVDDPLNRSYDIISTAALVLNLVVSILYTFARIRGVCGPELLAIESATVAFFALDYVLRLITAPQLYPDLPPKKAVLRYIFSAAGIIDLLSFVPHYLPFFFPTGAAAFRMFRVARILRLFRINAYYDSLNVITEVLQRKKQQLLSSVFIIGVLMIASSLVMYGLEHEAQPTVFKNAFSGIWWSASTLLTVGYGDIYPVTQLGKAVGIAITFLGVGMVAIPTGIISAGFVEQYQRLKQIGDPNASASSGAAAQQHMREVPLHDDHAWIGHYIRDLDLPAGSRVVLVLRDDSMLIADGSLVLRSGDVVFIHDRRQREYKA